MTGPDLPPRPRIERWQPAKRSPKPSTVKASVFLWTGAAALQIVSTALALLDIDALRADVFAEVGQTETQSTKDRVLVAALALLLGTGVLVALLQLAFGLNIGKRWARVALVLLAVTGALHGAVVFGALSSPYLVGLLAAGGAAVSAVVAMFLPASRAWFEGARK